MLVKMTNHDPHLQKTVSVNMRCLGPLRRRNCKNRYLLSKIDKEYLKKVECGTGLVMWILTKYITCKEEGKNEKKSCIHTFKYGNGCNDGSCESGNGRTG